MKRCFGLLVTLLILLPVSGSASTVQITSSTLSVDIGPLPPVSIGGNLSSLAVSSGFGGFTLVPGDFGPTTAPLPASLFTGVGQISGLTLAGLGNGTQFCTGPAPLSCAGGLTGTTLVNVLQLFNLSIPLNVVGSPGAITFAGGGGINITVIGQGWTAGVAAVTFTTTFGGITTSFRTGTDQRTPGHAGSLVLVSGFKAITNVVGTVPGFATMTFAPEPLELALLGIGVGVLGLYAGVRRIRR